MVFRQEQFDTGLAATALGALVLFALLVGGVLVLGRLTGNALFGTDIQAEDAFRVLPAVALTDSAPISVVAPPVAQSPPPPAPAAPPPQAPAPAAPAPPPAPAVEPAPAEAPTDEPVPAPSPLPEVPTLAETLDDPVGSVLDVSTNTVDSAGSTVEDILDVPLDLLFGDERKAQPIESYAAR